MLFSGEDPETRKYSAAAHLREVMALLRRPPEELLARSQSAQHLFTYRYALHHVVSPKHVPKNDRRGKADRA